MNDDMRRAAMTAGRHAGRTGLAITACPYNAGSDDPRQRALAGIWVREYLRARPSTAVTFTAGATR